MPGDLSAILGQASSSLGVHRAATATAAHNLQNANTPGFARQRAELTAVLPAEDAGRGQIGRGVSLLQITQARDQFLERQMPAALSSNAKSSAEVDILEAVSVLDPDSPQGLTNALANFYTGLRTMSQNPRDRGYRQAAVSAGETLANAFNQADHELETARVAVDSRLEAAVREINKAATSIAELNASIRQALASPSLPNDLMDTRQRHMDELAKLTGARAVDTGSGTVSMVLPGGLPLVHGFHAATVAVVPNGSNSGHLDITVTPPQSSLTNTMSATSLGGSVSGLLTARDGALLTARADLDQLAYDFSTAFNTLHRAGFGLDGVNNRNFFNPLAAAAGAAGTIAVNAAVVTDPDLVAAAETAAGTPGDGRNLLDLIASEESVMSGGGTVSETLADVMADYGSSAARARARNEQDANALDHLDKLREAYSGVSIDEELVNLTKSQRAFEAVMKVITTSDKMLETLMSIR